MKFLLKFIIVILVVSVIALVGVYLYGYQYYSVPILMYHQIALKSEESSLYVMPAVFERQMKFLVDNKYNVMTLDDFINAKENNETLKRKSVVLTFDDGHSDSYTHVYPILKKYQLPATYFVIVNMIDQPGHLTTEQIKELAASGLITIASHSLSGEYLPGKERGMLRREILASKDILEWLVKRKIEYFCYPIGGFTPEIQVLVKDSGYRAAFTTNRGLVQSRRNEDIFALKRIKIKNTDNPIILLVKLSGYYNLFRKTVEPHT